MTMRKLLELYRKVCPGLFYVEYDDFDFDRSAEMINERYRPAGPMCSGIRKGSFSGRNFDGYDGENTVLVMRVGNRCARYSSISVTTSYLLPSLSEIMAGQEKDDSYLILPQLAVDGVNEKGVSVTEFMVPNCEASEDRSSWGGRGWGKSAAYTNRCASRTYNTQLLPRYILDNASNVDEAIGLVRDVNWFDPDRFTSSGSAGSLKWLLADPRKSAVVECIDNELKIRVTDEVNSPSPCTLTTNFSSYLFSKGIIQDGASGYERYGQMAELYDREEDSIDGLKRILKSVSMSEKYRRDISDRFFFATDYLWSESPSGRHFTSTELYGGDAKKDPDFIETVKLDKSRYFDKSLRPEKHGQTVTIYTAVYDMEAMKLSLLCNEGAVDGRWYEFNLEDKS